MASADAAAPEPTSRLLPRLSWIRARPALATSGARRLRRSSRGRAHQLRDRRAGV